MNEHEMMQEIERLRRELAAMTKSRERLSEWLSQALGFGPLTQQELEELLTRPPKDVKDVLRDLIPADMHYLIDEKEESPQNSKATAHV